MSRLLLDTAVLIDADRGGALEEAYDRGVAEAHADLVVHVRRQGTTRGAHDLIIAATARAAERTVVSADEAAFVDLPGVQLKRHH
ncbi:MAG: hypothetical protein JO085_03235 [Acidimicrobiia bacterium]|nr:hypothetical protein [Acidimicrobiia bacterium]